MGGRRGPKEEKEATQLSVSALYKPFARVQHTRRPLPITFPPPLTKPCTLPKPKPQVWVLGALMGVLAFIAFHLNPN